MQSNFSKEELHDIIQWDVKNWKNALPFWSAHFDIKEGMKVLALGEREGGMSLYFAKQGCEVICSDYNEMPDETARMHKEKGVADKIEYRQIDMREIDFPSDSFDIVVFKSVIGALGDKDAQDDAIKEIHRVLRKDGAFLFAENAKGSSFHDYLRRKFVKWGERWRYINKYDIKQWRKLFSKSFVKSYGSLALFGRSEKQRSTLASADKLISPLTPKNWRYIYFGVFIK
jgi:ubiquinone/menaquinone biosynthesis C-methylase UbiE